MSNPLDVPELPTPPTTTPAPAPSSAAALSTNAASSSTARAPLAIEPPRPDEGGGGGGEDDVRALDVGEGQVVRLDKLGPMIVNSDGTLSRIQNWQDLHPIEQERTVRLLVKKRNLVRMRKLDAEAAGAGGDAGNRVSALAADEADSAEGRSEAAHKT
ncbi:hypothetical protein Q5752_002692 [Cryptotrichosporon argae]